MISNWICANVIINRIAIGAGLHLVVFNLIIGIFEGLCLGLIFKLPKWKTMGLMICANYASSLLGVPFLQEITAAEIEPCQIKAFIIKIVVAAYLLTLLLEFPFVYWACKRTQFRLIKSILGSLFVQTISYSILFAFWYHLVCSVSILDTVNWVETSDFIKNKTASMYYIDSSGKNIYRMNLDGSNQTLMNTSETLTWEELNFELNSKTNTYDLTAFPDPNHIIIQSALSRTEYQERRMARQKWGYYAEDLRGNDNQKWDIYRSVYNIYLTNDSTGQKISLRLDIPFLNWLFLWPVILPGDEVVFQWGKQICIYSCYENKLVVLTKGSSPVVFLEDPKKN